MPIIDMPLEQLKKYKGCSPCPEDIDEYWDEALSEVNAIDPKPRFVKADGIQSRTTEFYDLFYIGTKNAQIHARVAVPKKREKKVPALLKFHGLGGAADEWSDMLNYSSEGFVVAFMDARGQGGLSQDVGGVDGPTQSTLFTRGLEGDKRDLLYRDIYLDTVLLAKIIMGLDYVDETRVGVTGMSQGGALSIACAALVPEIKKCAVHFPYLSDFKRVYDMDLYHGAYEGINHFFKRIDPMHKREDEFFYRLGYIDIQNLAKRVKADVSMSTGLIDTTVPPSTQFAMYNKLTCNKNVDIFPEFGHEYLRLSHDNNFNFFCELL